MGCESHGEGITRLQNTLLIYINNPIDDHQHRVSTRFDVLWSRVDLVKNGISSTHLGAGKLNELLFGIASKTLTLLEQNDGQINQLDRQTAINLTHQLALLYPDTNKAAQLQFHFFTQIRHENKIALERFLLQICILFICMSLTAIFYPLFLRTELKNRKELIQIADQANASESTFLAKVSHEMRTPLNGILGNLQILEDEAFTPKTQSYLDDMQLSAKLLLDNINDLLDVTKFEYGDINLALRGVNIEQLMNRVLSPLSPLSKEKNYH